jgi:hypothetical protein
VRQETRLVRQLIRDIATAGETLTYEAAEARAGWAEGTSQNKNRGVLYNCFRWLEREHGWFAQNIPSVGYKFVRGNNALLSSEQLRTAKIHSQMDKFITTGVNCGADATPAVRNAYETKAAFLECVLSDRAKQIVEQVAAREPNPIDWRSEYEKSRELFQLMFGSDKVE